jgi:hypothetical protein
MPNENNRRMSGREIRQNAHAMAPVRAGYLDARAGKPYAPEHETAESWWQNNYTIGRLTAIELRASRGCAAAWPAHVILPRHVDEASRVVAIGFLARQDCG